MKNIIERIAGGGAKIARYLPKAVSTRLAVAALAALAAGGAWAAAGDTVTICNDLRTGGFATGTPTYSANDSYTITIPAVSGLSAGDYVRVSSFTFGRNSVNDTMNVAYVTSKDFLGDTIRSEDRTEPGGKFSKIAAFKEICAFGSAGDDNDLLLKVGTAYDFSLLNSSGAKTEQKVLAFTTTDGTYSPVAQDTTSTGTRMEQEVVCKVVSSAVVSASGTWSGLAFSNAPGDWSAATTAPVLVELTADSTLEINTDVNVESIVFAVPANVTLTLTGSKAITATTAISIKGGGSVCVAAGADVLSGPVKVASGTTFTFDFDNVAAPTAENPFGDALLASCSFSVLGSAQFSNVPANTIASIGDCGIRLVHNSVFGKWNATGQSMYAWRSAGTSGNFSACSVAPVTTSSGAVGGTETITWGKFCNGNGSYSAPAPAFYFDSVEYSMQRTPNFSPLTIGGLLVTAGGSTITRSDGQLELGDTRSTDAKIETYFVLAQSFGLGSFGKGGSFPNKIYGTVNIEAVEGATLTLPSQGITLDTATAANLKMHGAGNIALTGTITATGNVTLDYSDVDSGNTFIRGSLTVDASTKLVLPSWLSEGTPYTLCTGKLTAPSIVTEGSVQIGDGEATTATLLYNTTEKTVAYYTSIPEFTGTVSGSTIAWDSEPTQEQYAIGKIVLTGSGDVTLPYEPLAISADSGVTVDVTGYTTAAYSGEGTFKYTSGYRTHVPSGMTYQYAGSNDSANPTAIAGVTVDGTLKTSGYVNLTSLVIDAAGTLDVLSESSTVSTTTRSNGEGNLSCTIVIRSGATMVNDTIDGLDWGGTTRVDIYGTLSMGATRWSIRGFDNCKINLYPGAQVTGTGDGNGVFDLFDSTSKLNVYHGESGGTATISGPVRFRTANTKYPIWIASGATLELSGGTLGNGGFSMNGAGELKLSGTMGHGGASQVQDGTVTLDNIATAIPITVNAGKTLAVIATEAETIVPINATIAATGSIISSSGSGKVSGNIGFSNFSASQLDSNASGTLGAFLSGSSWTGTVTVPVHNTTSTERVYLANLGNSNSTIVLNGLSGNTHWIGDGSFPAELKIVGNVTFNNGGSGMNAEIGKVSGTDSTKTLTVAAWANCTGATYTINDLSEFEGAISVNGSNLSSGTFKLVIGNITKASYSYGTALVTCSTTPGTHGTTTIDLSNTTLNNTAANLVFDTDGIYLAEAAYNGANYKTLSAAVSAAEAASAAASAVTVYNSAATIPSGYALVKAAGGAMTLRSAGSGELIYWAAGNSGDWSGEDSNGTHTFYTEAGGTSTTPYVSGDTVVLTSDTQVWSKTAAHGAKFQIGTDAAQAEVHFTRSGENCNDYILDGSTIEIKSGSTLVAERYGYSESTRAYTAWDSYQNEHPDATAINNTTISGAGTLKIGGDTGGHGAVAAILSGTTSISCAIDLADGATLTVPSGCTVTVPTTSVADKMVAYSTDSETGTKTYSVVPTVARLVNGETETPYADIMTALGNLIQVLIANPAAYVQVLDGTVELANEYGAYGIGLDASTRRYVKAVAISGNAGYTTVQAAIDAVANEGSVTLKADCNDVLTLADGKTVTIVATVGSVTYTYTLPVAATPSSYRVIAGETVDGATTFTSKMFYTVTIPAGVEHASATVNGDAVAGGASVQVDAGSNITIAWTAASGYKITAGATQTINSIAANTTADAPTVEEMSAVVSNVNFTYGADYETATVTATVTGDATTYTLTVGGTGYAGVVNGSTVEFSGVETGHAAAYDTLSYSIAAASGETAITVSGGSGSAVVAEAKSWISADVSGTTGGSWDSSEGGRVAYENGKMLFEGTNTFAATCITTGNIVRIEAKGVVFNGENDDQINASAQGAVKVASDGNGGYVFKVLTAISGNVETWEGASEVTPTESGSYDVVVTFYYTDTPYYTVSVNGTLLSIASGVGNDTTTHIPNAQSGTTSLSGVGVLGSGSMTSLVGIELEGNMVIDNNGVKYATITAAITAYTNDSTIGPLKLLHTGTVPDGWKVENGELVRSGIIVDPTVEPDPTAEPTNVTRIVSVPAHNGTMYASGLIDKSNRVTGDQLKAFKKSNGTYHAWEFNGSSWDPLTITPTGSAAYTSDSADEFVLLAGEGVWVTYNINKPLRLNGEYAEAGKTEVTVISGYNLVGPPPADGGDTYSLEHVTAPTDTTEDKIQIPTEGAPITCQWHDDGKGGEKKWRTYKVWFENGEMKSDWVSPQIPSGTGFWYINKAPGSAKINL